MTETRSQATPAHGQSRPEWHPRFGPALPAMNWVPAPRYLMRRDILLGLFAARPPGSILEIGCGSGALLAELARQGFAGLGIEQSPSALHLARALAQDAPGFRIAGDLVGVRPASHDYVAAFEVLEHIEDDRRALSEWTSYLRPGGEVLVSVPAHPDRWNPADVWAGHFRRYSRQDIADLAAAAGLKVQSIQCYGYPFATLMEHLAAPVYARELRRVAGEGKAERTGASGSDRRLLTRLWPVYSRFPVRQMMQGVLALQRRSLGSERGIGYILVARKP